MFLTLKRALRRGIARSWWLSRLWYRRFGLRVEGRPADEVWYFAFGANMHDSAFRGRRRMHPIEWRPGRIRDYRLRFNLEGRPRGKAAPANVEPSPGAKVWGVLYKITRRDLIWLDSTEGVPGPRYRQLWIEAEDREGNRMPCVTYIAEGEETDGNPSLRYITLLRDGARAHGLPEHWVRTLEQVKHAE
ncbi:gamma-glutamylcyclotransferase family protein [Parvibaculum sp.]|jgi:cation transport regulator ChaC|uniref:gamma-glutamylcyclotransferase family protein n=1 Tax=Alphaproteobacteria TaxID=28211 RepID=UPI000C497E48|nr:gamma-glutamylcyclotransferase family protein [Parvibaculum sp.]MAC40109.1 gamma-glutamylcyclotransferase [Oceanicaulis sp.]MAU62720.1 gamma-glutamylcyclotransferase [Parvibaculum sp.]|tara:strand:- start:1960 stop:2526 length:567 start_codon:yes stop_codon:yes gene_type:complete